MTLIVLSGNSTDRKSKMLNRRQNFETVEPEGRSGSIKASTER